MRTAVTRLDSFCNERELVAEFAMEIGFGEPKATEP
jgi:hypothetical protein